MYYIYCYTNNINGKKYIGQTNNLLRRKLEHKSAAFNKNSPEYNLLFHQKLRQYGLENFTIEILEQGENNKNYIDEREIFWIKEKQSFVKENGYNLTTGGQNKNNKSCLENSKINKDILEIIKNPKHKHKIAIYNKDNRFWLVVYRKGSPDIYYTAEYKKDTNNSRISYFMRKFRKSYKKAEAEYESRIYSSCMVDTRGI